MDDTTDAATDAASAPAATTEAVLDIEGMRARVLGWGQ